MAAAPPGIHNVRRYYLLLSQAAAARDAGELELAWRGKQEATIGTALPASVPSQAALAVAHYTTVEDLDGATVDELARAGLSRREASAVIAAL